MLFKEYIQELDLIKAQNDVECDFYCIIAPLLKRSNSLAKYSIRDISQRKRTKSGTERIFWGVAGFPDFVIIDKKYTTSNVVADKSIIHGVVEAKYVGKPLLEEFNDKLQLIGHLLSFGFVIYTNGYIWRIYSNSWNDSHREVTEMENKSFIDTRGKSTRAKIATKEINNWLNSHSLDDLAFEEYILKDESGWKEDAWSGLLTTLENVQI